LCALAVLLPATTPAADIFWSGGNATYNTPAAWGGSIPGLADKAINDSGAANAVLINPGDPDWIVNGLLAGRSTGNGAFVQNGQSVYLTNVTGRGAVRLGVAPGRSGSYTLNGGALNYTGDFNVGELGTATLNVNGGAITGNGNLAINVGSTLDNVNATMDGGTNKGGHTWFEQGFYTFDPTRGLPLAGATIVSVSQADHSYKMPPSYAANNAVFLAADAATNATITLSAPTAATALSFLGSAGGGAATLNYTIHFNGAPDESGTLNIPDWYPPAEAVVALNVGGRVEANGFNFQNVDGGIEVPKLVSIDLNLANTVNQITSISLTRVSGGRAGLLALSKSVGTDFSPLTITGYNADIVMGATENTYVANNITNTLNQTAGNINITGEMFVGNVGAGIYNLSGGTNTVANYIGIGRSGGQGVLNMTGGVLNKTGNGHLIFGTPYQNLPGHDVSGVLNHSGGTINMQSGQVWFPEGSSPFGTVSGTYNLSGSAVLNVGDWFAIGRNGASGTLNMTGGTINKSGGGQPAMIIADGGGAVGQVTHSAGTINCSSELWIGQNGGSATYNLSGTAALNVTNWFAIGRSGNGANGALTMTGGSLNQSINGVFIVGDNSQGAFLHSAGPVATREFWVGNGGGGNGNYDLTAPATLAVSGWVVIGRDGMGQMNMNSGTFTKTTGDGRFIIASGGTGYLNQSGGTITSTLSDTWVGENGTATWTLSPSATATLGLVRLGVNTPGSGTFNLYGGTLTATEIAGGNGTANLNFGGGTLVAAASGNFIHDLDAANLEPAGAIINTAGYNVTVASALLDAGGGALTKNGLGNLTLTGPNTYVGATTVNAGKLTTTTAATGAGSFAVANAAGLGVQVAADNAQLPAASVSFAGSTSTLDVDLNTFGSPGAAPLAIAGALNVNGTVTVNILAGGALQIGVYPLVSSGSRSGAGTFLLGTLPLNTTATLVDNGTTINLNINDVNAPRWEGLAGGNWDIGLTTNWINGGSGLPTYFSEGSEVRFNDEALGTTSVNLVTTVHPTSVTFNHTNLAYTLSGAGKISGATGLAKQGGGTLTIVNNHDFTGPTVISGGVVSVANLANAGAPSPIGSGNLVLAGGTLSYTGPASAINRGYTVQGVGGAIETLNNLTLSGVATAAAGSGFQKLGTAQLAYTGVGSNYLAATDYQVRAGAVVLDGSTGAQTNRVQGTFSVAGAVNAVAVLTNTTLTVNDNSVGDVAGSVGAMTQNQGTTLNVNSWFKLGDAANSVSSFTLNGGTVNVPSGRFFLGSAPGTITTLNINGGVINHSGDRFVITDGGWNGVGARTGVVNQVSGTVNTFNELWVGQWGPSQGFYNLSGDGILNLHDWTAIGRESGSGTFTMSGGTINKTDNGHFIVGDGNGSHGEFHQSGGVFNDSKELWVGQGGGSVGTYNLSSGTINLHDWAAIGRDGGNGTFNMTGGTINKDGNGDFLVTAGNGSIGVLNQSGGTITSTKPFLVPQWGNSSTLGTYNLTNGVANISSWVAVGRDGGVGEMNVYGGLFAKVGDPGSSFIVGASGIGTLNQYGGTISNTVSDSWISENNTATWNMNGGSAILGFLQFSRNGSGVATLNFNGGVIAASEIAGGAGLATNNYNGGTIRASANTANFLHDLDEANVLAGGLTIDSGTNTIGVAQTLIGNGGLTKVGSGTLNLNGVNTYAGATLVNAGTLGGNGTIAGPVSVAAAATLSPGTSIGTLTINNTLSLAGTSTTVIEVSKNAGTSDLVTGVTTLTYGGTLVLQNLGGVLAVGDTFNVFDATTFSGSFGSVVSVTPGQVVTWDTSKLNVDGTVKVATAVAASATLASAVSGGSLNLSWPAGWRLEAQTNSLAMGLSGNWGTVPGAQGVTSLSVPIVTGNPAVFYRLAFP